MTHVTGMELPWSDKQFYSLFAFLLVLLIYYGALTPMLLNPDKGLDNWELVFPIFFTLSALCVIVSGSVISCKTLAPGAPAPLPHCVPIPGCPHGAPQPHPFLGESPPELAADAVQARETAMMALVYDTVASNPAQGITASDLEVRPPQSIGARNQPGANHAIPFSTCLRPGGLARKLQLHRRRRSPDPPIAQ